ncbi:hypothetical protein BD626DRAFT_553277 [Schizophyllum amplum]|uniref:Uncharacterized protein n=1 Tax=Schizophyllum amplum TaxID=97359 RepID=A0A550BRR2_9AGAR|nr:hypothetical protein BD626DRAFT_553277 [Auriculariopsis ampla]
MVQSNFCGPTAIAFLEWTTPSSLSSLSPYSSTLSVILNETGGIDVFYIVTNVGRRKRDLAWIQEKLAQWDAGDVAKQEGPVEHEVLDSWGLLALQSPEAAGYIRTLASFDLRTLTFGKSAFIFIPPSQTVGVAQLLSQPSSVQLIGLGARNSLLLEAG